MDHKPGHTPSGFHSRQVEMRVHKPTGAVSYANLMRCGSPWVCPVCSATVTERRALEVESALSKHLAAGGVAYFVTYTVPHLRRDSLEALREGFQKARAAMRRQRRYRELMSRMGALGDVYAVEAPYSNNGWHPHGHSLIFAEKLLDEGEVREILYTLWSDAVANKTELGQTSPKAFDVTIIATQEEAQQIGNYLAKGSNGKPETQAETWGPGRELAKGASKITRRNGASAFELLRIYHQADDQAAKSLSLSGHAQAGALFAEFGKATKGTRQLRWSKGLRKALGLEAEKTDQEIAEEAQLDTEILGTIPAELWRIVTRHRIEGDLLEIARLDGWAGVQQALQFLRNQHQAPPSD